MKYIFIALLALLFITFYNSKEHFWEPEWRGWDRLYSSNQWNKGNNWRWHDYIGERGRIKYVKNKRFPYGIKRISRHIYYGGWV